MAFSCLGLYEYWWEHLGGKKIFGNKKNYWKWYDARQENIRRIGMQAYFDLACTPRM